MDDGPPNLLRDLLDEFSHIQPYREYSSECSYCRRPQRKGRVAYGAQTTQLTCCDYEEMLERNWMRSGSHLYQPSNDKSCCPNLAIRLDALAFAPDRRQLKVLRQFRQYLTGERPLALPAEDNDTLSKLLRLAEAGHARAAAESVCNYRATGNPDAATAAGNSEDEDGDDDEADGEEEQKVPTGGGPGTPAPSTAAAPPPGQARSSLLYVAGLTLPLPVDCCSAPNAATSAALEFAGACGLFALLQLLAASSDRRGVGGAPSELRAVLDKISVSQHVPGSRLAAKLHAVAADAAGAIPAQLNAAFVLAAAVAASPGSAGGASASSTQCYPSGKQDIAQALVAHIAHLMQVLDAEQRGSSVAESATLPSVTAESATAPFVTASASTTGAISLSVQVGSHAAEGIRRQTGRALALCAEAARRLAQSVSCAACSSSSGSGSSGSGSSGNGSSGAAAHSSVAALLHIHSLRSDAAAAAMAVPAARAVAAELPPSCMAAGTPQQRRALRLHYRAQQDAAEAAGAAAFLRDPLNYRFQTDGDGVLMPAAVIAADEDEFYDAPPPEEGGEEGAGTGTKSPSSSATLAAGAPAAGAGAGADAAGHRLARHAARVLQQRSAKLAADVAKSEKELLRYLEQGVGSHMRALRARAVAGAAAAGAHGAGEDAPPDAAATGPAAASAAANAAAGAAAARSVPRYRLPDIPDLPPPAAAEAGGAAAPPGGAPPRGGAGPLPLLLPWGRGPHRLAVRLRRPRFTVEAQELYARFNLSLHRGRPGDNTRESFTRHLVASPLLPMHAADVGLLARLAAAQVAGEAAGTAPLFEPVHVGDAAPGDDSAAAPARAALAGLAARRARLGALAARLGAEALQPSELAEVLLGSAAAADPLAAWHLCVVARRLELRGRRAYVLLLGQGADEEDSALPPGLLQAVPALPSALDPLVAALGDMAPQLGLSYAALLAAVFALGEELLAAAERFDAQLRLHEAAAAAAATELRRALEAALAASAASSSSSSTAGEAAAKRMRPNAAGEEEEEGGDEAAALAFELDFGQARGAAAAAPPPAVPPPPSLPPGWLHPATLQARFLELLTANEGGLYWLQEAATSHMQHVAGMLRAAAEYDAARPPPLLRAASVLDEFFVRAAPAAAVAAAAATAAPAASAAPAAADALSVEGWDLSMGYGTFWHEYSINDTLVAVSVLDVLPTRVASVYFFYNPDLRYLQLGKVSAFVEAWLARQMCAHAAAHPQLLGLDAAPTPPPALCRWWDGNFYVHSNPSMRYKRHFRPSQLLCPRHNRGHWVDIQPAVLRALDAEPCPDLVAVAAAARGGGGGRDGGGDGGADAEEAAEAAGAKALMSVTMQLIPPAGRQAVLFELLNRGALSLLERGMLRYLRAAGPDLGRRLVVDPSWLAGLESQHRAEEGQRAAARAARLEALAAAAASGSASAVVAGPAACGDPPPPPCGLPGLMNAVDTT